MLRAYTCKLSVNFDDQRRDVLIILFRALSRMQLTAASLLVLAACALGADAFFNRRTLLTSGHNHSGTRHTSSWPGEHLMPHISEDMQRVAIVNPYPFCWDVVFGITYAFTSLAHTVDVYADTSPGNSLHHVAADTVLHSITKRPVVDMAQLNNASQSYDLIVYADWYPRDCWGPEDTSLREMLDAGYAGRVWIFTHEPGALFWAFVEKSESTEKLRADPDFVRRSWEIWNLPQVQWFAIAPHVANRTQYYFKEMGLNKTVHWACPVAPAEVHSTWQLPQHRGKKGLAVQGSLDRRNYTGLFQQLEVRPDIYKNKLFEIQTYAWGGLEEEKIPKPLRPKIIAKEGLDFPDFYGNMSQNIAMMTLFDTDRYYNEAASSTTIVAMSTSTPLIVEPGFAEVYSHIGAGGFLEAKNGDYAAAIAKVLQMTAEEWENLAMEMVISREANVLRSLQTFAHVFQETRPAQKQSHKASHVQ